MKGLLATKVRPPALPAARVRRPQLLQRLDDGLALGRPLTLVSAPAGFGKTTCIAGWVQALERPVAWLSLDPADDDPLRFFTYLVAALQRIDESLGQEIAGLLHAGQLPPGEIIAATLVNDLLARDAPLALVLDDLQLIQAPFTLEVLEQLVENVPPSLHLVLLTREDPSLPLARLRAHNRMTEIRAADLRFAGEEVADFLNDVMNLALAPAEVAALEERTEGWAVGLQLAALSLRGRADAAAFVAGLSGSHRHILTYLTEEVLNRQPEEIRRFLLQTSILERLSAPLCDAVTQRSDSAALLEQLFAANLFLIPLDDEGQWYRYHQLFADLLRDLQSTLPGGEKEELHRRAGRWYACMTDNEEQHLGDREAFVDAAIRHALAAGDETLAVQLIEKHALKMLLQWQVRTVEGWIQALPAEWRMHSPQANLALVWINLMRGEPAGAAPYLEQLEAIFSDPGAGEDDPALLAQWMALQAMLLNAQQRPEKSLALARRALEIVPEREEYVRGQIALVLAGAYQQLGDDAAAREAYRMLIREGRAAGNLVFELLGTSALGLMALDHGELHFAFEIASQGIERMERSGALLPIGIAQYGELAQVYYQWHSLEEAHRYFRRAAEVGRLSGFSDAQVYHGIIRARLHYVEGHLEAAVGELESVVDLARVEALAAVREEVVAERVRIYLAQGRLTAAEVALAEGGFSLEALLTPPAPVSTQGLTHPRALLYNSALRILLHRGRVRGEPASLERALALAGGLIDAAERGHYLPALLETLLLRAQVHAALGDQEHAMADAACALELGEPEGFVSLFVEQGPPVAAALQTLLEQQRPESVQPAYVRRILDAFGPAPAPEPRRPQKALVEPLSDRELEVLHLIAAGLKYREIAERLFISLNTVRTHVKAIYGKLGVNNRRQATERGHELGLL
ncbi:MAG: LuxR C-terminal-related transcriptional regulator [Anaerolineales bacterium]